MEEILETACPSTEGSEEEGTVGNTLGARGCHRDGVMSRDTRDDLTSLRKGLDNDWVGDCGGLLLIRGADPREDDDLLDWTAVLLINPHDAEKPINSDKLGGGNARDPGVVDRYGKVVRLETPGKTTNGDLAQYAHLAGDLGL